MFSFLTYKWLSTLAFKTKRFNIKQEQEYNYNVQHGNIYYHIMYLSQIIIATTYQESNVVKVDFPLSLHFPQRSAGDPGCFRAAISRLNRAAGTHGTRF